MEEIKAIVYGVGLMGRIMTKLMVEKGVVIVGAVDIANVGKDLGELAGLGYPLNVKIRDDADTVLGEQKADIAIVAVATEIEEMYPHLKRCLENGLNVITTAEEASYPWIYSPETTAKLDKLAREHGVTITGGGYQDSFMINLVSLLTGSSHTIDSIVGRLKFDLDTCGPFVAEYYHVGSTREEFDSWFKGHTFASVCRGNLSSLAADLGLTIKRASLTVKPIIEDVDIEAKRLGKFVKKGDIAGLIEIDEIETVQGVKIQSEAIFKVFRPDEVEFTEWHIKGDPELYMKTEVPSVMVTGTQMVNRIPDVINAEPGYITADRLPKLKCRTYPLHFYLHRR